MVAKNHLIEALPRTERQQILAICEPIKFSMAETLFDVGTITRHVYFPTDGHVSLLSVIDEGSVLEVGMVGNEGMVGVHVALGSARSTLRAVVQKSGTAWRVPVGPFKRELAISPVLRMTLNRYVTVLLGQLASSASCTRFHAIGPRLARWLLRSQDRAGSDRFYMTHEFLSSMLGVRREGVTTAAVSMQSKGLINYHRGQIQVLDRLGLEAASCSCYATDQASFATLSR